MRKSAQPYDPSEFQGYGQGGLAGYGQGGYDVGLENVGLVPGMDPQLPEKAHVPGLASPWAVPVGLAAGGLVGYSLLKRMGSRLAAKAARGAPAATTAAIPPRPPISPEVAAILGKWAPKQASLIEALGILARR